MLIRALLLTLMLALQSNSLASAETVLELVPASEEPHPIMQANGRFEVILKPLETYNQAEDAKMGRMSIDKTFEGDLEGTSRGEMISGGSPAEGWAGYVAIEHVTGSLGGKSGSFLLQHSATMSPEGQELNIIVIPGSGTGELEGLSGTMKIVIQDGKHAYVFEYSLPDASP